MATSPRRFAWPRLDKFTLMLIGTVLLATILPARGVFVPLVDIIGRISIILLFFLHGANLSTEAVVQALGQWKLHLMVLAATYILFPIIGLALAPLSGRAIDPALYTGLLFLCCLPSTVQSSIAFTSIARGNVPAAICAASASNLFGIVLTPMLTGLLLSSQSAISIDAIWSIVGTILLPFGLGMMLHSRIGGWIKRNKPKLGMVDRSSVLIMVYAAFGKAVIDGLWQSVSAADLAVLVLVCIALLGLVMVTLTGVSRFAHLSHGDETALVFCGSKKSLITGVPMASVLFPAATVGAIVLPLMIFHQIQLIVCAFLARSYEKRALAQETTS
ncbi:bile acid:sodium symporter family protein [Sphingobium nicotianae]|uniref:Bile acid:sodium symporter family protein n=1 Tax=Sphingobium nicotianae TaxID=2782607 RepID=A0A9X1IR36_9SPHN|nr:bile acid:sodium symporter family protein [Sphingobium nicotianae]MBT2186915.1 bile acid:sodium symporter family protein [Sphingobium nicotianae]